MLVDRSANSSGVRGEGFRSRVLMQTALAELVAER
jgi:hypothetical protein